MNRLGQKFFSRPGFASEQYGGIAPRPLRLAMSRKGLIYDHYASGLREPVRAQVLDEDAEVTVGAGVLDGAFDLDRSGRNVHRFVDALSSVQ